MHKQSGSALVYILIAIALLAALTASFMRPSSQQTTAQSGFNLVSELKSQISFIRTAIQECVLINPGGDNNLVGTSNFPFPINPSSGHLASPSANNKVRNIRCPGNPGGASNNHAKIFGGSSGKFMPPTPDLFEDWEYFNGLDGIFFYTSTSNTDAFIGTALQKLDDEYSECEADIIDATGAAEELTSTAAVADPKCPSGSTCFRVWVITQNTAVYNGDTDGEETAATCP